MPRLAGCVYLPSTPRRPPLAGTTAHGGAGVRRLRSTHDGGRRQARHVCAARRTLSLARSQQHNASAPPAAAVAAELDASAPPYRTASRAGGPPMVLVMLAPCDSRHLAPVSRHQSSAPCLPQPLPHLHLPDARQRSYPQQPASVAPPAALPRRPSSARPPALGTTEEALLLSHHYDSFLASRNFLTRIRDYRYMCFGTTVESVETRRNRRSQTARFGSIAGWTGWFKKTAKSGP